MRTCNDCIKFKVNLKYSFLFNIDKSTLASFSKPNTTPILEWYVYFICLFFHYDVYSISKLYY